MEEVRCGGNKQWIWIIIAVLLLSGNFGSGDNCCSGSGIGNFLGGSDCGGNKQWIWILALVFLFNGGFNF